MEVELVGVAFAGDLGQDVLVVIIPERGRRVLMRYVSLCTWNRFCPVHWVR